MKIDLKPGQESRPVACFIGGEYKSGMVVLVNGKHVMPYNFAMSPAEIDPNAESYTVTCKIPNPEEYAEDLREQIRGYGYVWDGIFCNLLVLLGYGEAVNIVREFEATQAGGL